MLVLQILKTGQLFLQAKLHLEILQQKHTVFNCAEFINL